MKAIFYTLLTALLTLTTFASMASEDSISELALRLNKAVVEFQQSGRHICTATKIADRTYLTAGHCVRQLSDSWRLESSEGTYVWPRSVTVALQEKKYGSRREDWAILNTNSTNKEVGTLSLGCGESIYMGMRIAYLGFPADVERAFLTGIVASVNPVRNSVNDADFVVDVPAAGGASGSAVISLNSGNIIGILTEGVPNGRGGFFLTGIESVNNLDICKDQAETMKHMDATEGPEDILPTVKAGDAVDAT